MREPVPSTSRPAPVRSAILRAAWSLIEQMWYPRAGAGAGRLPPAIFRPFEKLYLAGLHRHRAVMRRNSVRLPAFVLSVGNIVAGGTGKTPLALWTADIVHGLGLRPAILSRGYGRSGKGTARAPSSGDLRELASEFGDEPVLMAHKMPSVPVWVGRRRSLSGCAAIDRDGATVLICDDGFQHLALERDLDLVVIDGESPFGNGLLLPFGPLREPVESLRRADALIVCRGEEQGPGDDLPARLAAWFPGKPVFTGIRRPGPFRMGIGGSEVPLELLESGSSIAFAGIGRPERFFSSLARAGVRLAETIPFPDHHRYTEKDVAFLLERASRLRATFIATTEKDAVKLPGFFREAVVTNELRLDFGSDLTRFRGFLEAGLKTFFARRTII